MTLRLRSRYVEGRLTLARVDDPNITPLYCGESWCTGVCNRPALVLLYNGREYKAHSDMVAVGPVFQPFRIDWHGEKTYIDGEDPEKLLQMMWW